jgi:tRNA(His) guanylyltransferase
VRAFEHEETLLPNTWIVVRIDGRGFHKLSSHYGFSKPNDRRALDLMNDAASHVVRRIPDIALAYGVSDEYSFVFERQTALFDRRRDKLVSTVVSTFTAAYTLLWPVHFPIEAHETQPTTKPLELEHLPTFDGRAVIYPTAANLRDYLSWRQVDCHINNLYNTTFWSLVLKGGMNQREAEEHLKGTVSSDKNEILFSRFQTNYNDEPDIYKKGSVAYREYAADGDHSVPVKDNSSTTNSNNQRTATPDAPKSRTQQDKERKRKAKAQVVVRHVDLIKDDFWARRPWLLDGG